MGDGYRVLGVGNRESRRSPAPDTQHPLVLPARLADARDHPVERQLAEADAAHPELPQEGSGAAAALAAVLRAHLELRRALALLDHGLTSHRVLSLKTQVMSGLVRRRAKR